MFLKITFVAILFTLAFASYLTQDVFADVATITAFTANDPDDGDTTYSVGDTLTITFDVATNQTGVVTDANVAGNFTFAGIDIQDNTFSGTWTSNTILTLTVDAIGTSAVITTTTISAAANNNIGRNDEAVAGAGVAHNAEGTNIALGGDFGLFVAVTTTSTDTGSGCDNCEAPTLGINESGQRLVDDGFTYNGNSIDVERYFTPYPLVTVDVGKQNVAEFKIYDDKGPDSISHFELAFGLSGGESIGKSKVVINWDKSWDGVDTITLDDPENVLDKIKVTTSEGNCSDESQTKCLIVKVVHTFRAPLDFNILGTNVWDTKRNAWQNYYNHGIEVVGESLNPPKEYDGINRGQIYHLTETSKTTAVDEFGGSWSLEYGLWAMDYIPNKKSIDGTTMHGYDRTNSNFEMYKYYQYKLAEITLNELCPNCNDKSFDNINDIFTYEYPISQSSLDNPEIQSKMLFESERAQKIIDALLDPMYYLK